MSDTLTTLLEAAKSAFTDYATQYHGEAVAWRPFREAFIGGQLYGRLAVESACICKGTGSREFKDHGHCTCPGCRPFRHLVTEDKASPECGMLSVDAINTTDELSEVTCADCFLRLLGDTDKCGDCGDENYNLCNGCR